VQSALPHVADAHNVAKRLHLLGNAAVHPIQQPVAVPELGVGTTGKQRSAKE